MILFKLLIDIEFVQRKEILHWIYIFSTRFKTSETLHILISYTKLSNLKELECFYAIKSFNTVKCIYDNWVILLTSFHEKEIYSVT